MDKQEQARIINELCDAQRAKMLEGLDRIPENWDGHELRWWFVDVADEGLAMARHAAASFRGRLREYSRVRLVNNL